MADSTTAAPARTRLPNRRPLVTETLVVGGLGVWQRLYHRAAPQEIQAQYRAMKGDADVGEEG